MKSPVNLAGGDTPESSIAALLCHRVVAAQRGNRYINANIIAFYNEVAAVRNGEQLRFGNLNRILVLTCIEEKVPSVSGKREVVR